MAERTDRNTWLLGALVTGLGALFAFGVTLGFGFVYDDRWTVVQNRWLDAPVRDVLALAMNGSAHGMGVPDATRPSMILSLWIDRRLSGASPVGFHAHSVLLYAVACVAALLAAAALLRERRAAIAAALFFTLAPLHAEAVAAVNYREDLIAAIGMLVPLAYLFRPSEAKDTPGAGIAIAAVWAWGLFGKESAVALVPLLATVAALSRVDAKWLEARERTLWLLGAALVFWLNWRLALAAYDDGLPRAASAGVSTRLSDTARFVVRGVASSLAPVRPSPEYAPQSDASVVWIAALAGVTAFVVALSRRPTWRSVSIGVAIAAVAPLGASPLAGPVNAWADRYVFVGVFGGALVFGVLVSRLAIRLGDRLVLGAGAVAGAVAVFGCLVAARVWQNERALWSYAVAQAPDSARAWAALSRVERLDGNLDEADRLMARALAVKSDDVSARITQVYNLLARGKVDSARDVIGLLERRGAGRHPALGRARVCAEFGAEGAKRCIRGGS